MLTASDTANDPKPPWFLSASSGRSVTLVDAGNAPNVDPSWAALARRAGNRGG